MSAVDICNSALMRLGAERINALNESNKKAITCNEHYDKLRKKLLRQHLWNFAVKRASLAKLVGAPEFEFLARFQLPTDCLKVVSLKDKDVTFRIEGQELLCDEDTVKIQYIADITDTSLFTPDFEELFALKLAIDMCMTLTQDRRLREDLRAEYAIELRDTRSVDAQEGTPPDIINDLWINSRL